jgi:transcriptional regulator with XRE-family HTH domain
MSRRHEPSSGAGDPRNLIGPRIRSLRHEQGLTLVELGRRAGVTHAFLSQVERGRSDPSLRTLGKISAALGVSVGSLLHAPVGDARSTRVTRADDPEAVIFTGESGAFQLSTLTGATSAFHALVARGHHPATVGGHAGDELVLVLEGALEMTVDGEAFLLRKGDALCFDGSRPHVYDTVGDEEPRFLVVVADASGVRTAGRRDGRSATP